MDQEEDRENIGGLTDMDMRWYIFNKDDEPLTWDDKAIYFPSLLSANAFIEATKDMSLNPKKIITRTLLLVK